ncbi:hypothetical protein [Krasilnikovia sp. MM14-A1259]|uniref:hypothetical protein n=1 Tax=Krasilnikovia sp. MM14-A1259 TaxID=3373539 RepID=UPI00399CDA18
MWEAIADQNTEPHYEVVQGWRRTSELTLTHLAAVRTYRDNLAEAWPPERSPASAAYLARLDGLIHDLTETQAAASTNYTTFSTVTLTLNVARTKLEPLYKEYVANQASLAKWQAERDAATAASHQSSSPVPTPRPQASPVPTAPPIPIDRQEELNNQARSIMYDLSDTVISAQSQLQKPALYEPTNSFDEWSGNRFSVSESASSRPPSIPAPTLPSTAPDTNISHPVTTATRSPIPLESIQRDRPAGSTLSMAQVITPPFSAPNNSKLLLAGAETAAPGSTASAPIRDADVIRPMITPPLARSTPSEFAPRDDAAAGRPLRPVHGAPSERVPTVFSERVIGSTPGGGPIGQTPVARNSQGHIGTVSRQANPVGGVIDSKSTSSSLSNRATRAAASRPWMITEGGDMTWQGRGNRSASRADPNHSRWDPDNPWEIVHGVDPILLPPIDPGPIDPGPAIGISA